MRDALNNQNQVTGDEPGAACKNEFLARKIFRLVLGLTTEPSKLLQARMMLLHLQKQGDLPEDFSCWALRQIEAKVRSIALECPHDAEILVQRLSFKGGTLDGLIDEIEDMYQHEQITQRVYARAKLLIRSINQ